MSVMLDEGAVDGAGGVGAPSPHDAPPSTPRRRHRSRLVAAGSLVLFATVGIAVWRLAGSAASGSGDGTPRFVEEAAAAGVEHRYEGGFDYFVGGGVAVLDCDGDGFSDLFLAGGTAPAALYRNAGGAGAALRFDRVASAATDLTAVTGAYPIDIDSDGVHDLVVLRKGAGNEVLRGLGGCLFEDATADLGLVAGDAWTAAFSATWEAGNALPTLAFGNYLVPRTTDCAPSDLVRPAAAGGYGEPSPMPTDCTLSVLFSDWGRTGERDLRVANDRHYYRDGGEQLFRIEAGAEPRAYTADDGWRSLQIWGMGIASDDLTGDGRPEIFLTSQGDNKLQTLDDGATRPVYHDIALERGVTAQRPVTGGDALPSTAWHPEFDDVDNDGLLDLFVTKGNVEAQPDYASRDPNDLFLGRSDGTFVAASVDAGIVRFERSRGAAVADLNRDGLLDLVVVNREAGVELWRNVGSGDAAEPAPMGHWVSIGLWQPAPNVDAVGAWIEVRTDDRTVSREVTIGGGHASGQLGWTHVGLGDATSAEVRVQWPDGELGDWTAVDPDRYLTIDRT